MTPRKLTQDYTDTMQELTITEEELKSQPFVHFVYMQNGQMIIGSASSEDLALAAIPSGSNYKFVLNNELQSLDKDYLDSYVLDAGEIKPTLEKTKEVKKRLLRIQRRSILESLDVDFMRAIESGDTELQATVVQKKQKLRDITNSVDLAKTIDEVKQITL